MIVTTQQTICDLCGGADAPFAQELSATATPAMLKVNTVNAAGLYVDLCDACWSAFTEFAEERKASNV